MPRPQRDDGLSAWRVQSTTDEVGLAAKAGVDPSAHVTRVRLGEQVHFERGVDREHRRLSSDAGRIVDDLRAPHHEARIVVGPFVELFAAEHERRRHDSFGVESAGVFEVYDTVAEHLGPHAKSSQSEHWRERGVR